MDDTKKTWGPAWRYGPNGQSQIFENEADVPAGWQDHPSKVGEKAKAAPAPTPTPTPAPASVPAPAMSGTSTGNAAPAAASNPEIDRDGYPWSADLHASSKSRTKDDLWRMKVGVKRPDPLPGFPKQPVPALDL